VEGGAHDAVGSVECLLDAVAVVDVDVDVEHARVRAEELEDRQDDVVDVAEARGLALFRVVQPAGPVYCYVGSAAVYPLRSRDGAPGRDGAELKDALKRGVVR
jgi:hypothetical protein